MIRHIVALRYAASTPARDRQAILADLSALRGHLKGILDFQPFRNISAEDPLVHGFRDGFWFDFTDEAARDAYLADAAHQAVGARIIAACIGGAAGVHVIDIAL